MYKYWKECPFQFRNHQIQHLNNLFVIDNYNHCANCPSRKDNQNKTD